MRLLLGVVSLALIVVVALSASCSSDDPLTASSGNVAIWLTDAPIDMTGVNAVNVTLSEMILFQKDDDGNGETEHEMQLNRISAGEGMVINLLDFQDGQVILVATANVPAGEFAKLRMRVEAAELERDDDGDPDTPDIVEPIFVPSGKVDVPMPFTISGGEEVDVTVDFDAALSIHLHETGNHKYILRPVINTSNVHRR